MKFEENPNYFVDNPAIIWRSHPVAKSASQVQLGLCDMP